MSTLHPERTEITSTNLGTAQNSMKWFAVQTWPRYEMKVAAELKHKGIEAFLPLFSSEHRWSDRRRMVEVPVFPTYLFVYTPGTTDSRISVLRTTGVTSFVGSHKTGTPIPEGEIESVRLLLNGRVSFKNHPFLNIGQRIRIRGSSLDGVEGIFLARNDDCSLIVSINILQRSLAVRLTGYPIDTVPV